MTGRRSENGDRENREGVRRYTAAMPGPGPHMMYALGSGQALMSISNGKVQPSPLHHLRPQRLLRPGSWLLLPVAHCHLRLSWVSRILLQKGFLDSISGVPLTRRQCFLLLSAGSLSHFFLDHLFEENGHSSMYTWILSTGWWEGRAPVNPDAVVVVGFLCTCLVGGFIYINRAKPLKSIGKQSNESAKLILIIASLYCLWCASQIYLVNPRRPAVGEEADLGVLLFLGIYFFLPHWLCIMSMNPKDLDTAEKLPV
ncbi:hypothetical protein F0562_024803 [Nyssa sinensis]|uniref:Uncharacterized protein n=1 Tax=Nyssa sinensis TaxID=561372 RepID=A0A5J5BEY2_9ASTE|nr:hypothetical protein F0562_024803 [Nyssa sinensis]